MTTQWLLAFLTYSVVSSFTPGPNNLMMMSSGANFGVRRTLPHMAGVVLGFSMMLAIVGLGLFGLFRAWPPSFTVLKVVSVLYTLWLAWKIANADAPHSAAAPARPMSFVQAVAFQWVNGKAWTMGLSAITLYAADARLGSILLLALLFLPANIGAAATWTLMGLGIRRWLSSPARLRAFNWTMAALLVGSIGLAVK